jgi:hypothetical protein
MTELTAGDPERTMKDKTAPGPASVALRPLGYLLVGLVWLTIWLVAVGLLVGSVLYLAYDDPESLLGGGGRAPVAQALGLLVAATIAAAVIGPGAWHVLTASWPLAVLSFTYLVRSMRPSYAGEKLSSTTHAAPGTTFGPPTAGAVALSLQPVRATRFTDGVMRFYVAGWTVSLRMLLAMVPAGFAWTTAIVAIIPGAPDAVHVVGGVLTVVLLGVSLVLGVRAFRIGDFDADPADDKDVSVTSASPKERARRLKKVKKQRAKRQCQG